MSDKFILKEDWGLDDEREYMEKLLHNRFNFFLVFVSLFFVAIFEVENLLTRSVLLAFGVYLSHLFKKATSRTNELITKTLDSIKNNNKHHPYYIAQDGLKSKNANDYIAIKIPNIINYLFIILLFITIFELLS